MNDERRLSSRVLELVWKQRFPSLSIPAHLFALACIAVALLLNVLLEGPGARLAPYVTLFPAILLAAVAGGGAAGLTALVAGGIGAWLFLVPDGPILVTESTKFLNALLYAATGVFLIALVELMRRAVGQLDASKQQVQDGRDRLVAALEASGAGTWRWDIQNDRVEWDEALCQVYGIEPKDAPRTSAGFIDLVHPDDRARTGEVIRRCIEEGAPTEYEFRAVVPKGVVWIYDRSRLVRDAAGRPAFMLGACLDITGRRKAEEERGRIATWLAMAMDVAQIGTWEIDPKAETLTASATMNAIFGLPADGRTRLFADYLDLIHPDDVAIVREAVAHRSATNEPVSVEYRLVRPDGEIRWLASRGAFVRGADGSGRIVGSLHDITDRKRIEEEREAALRQRELLLRELNHRVKNNLQMVSSLLSLQASRMQDEAAAEHFRKAIDRVLAVGDIHARLYQGEQLGRIDFDQYLESLCARLRDSMLEGRSVELDVKTEPVELDIDRAVPLGLTVNELVTNAIKHAFDGKGGGRIAVTLTNGAARGEALRLTIEDNGRGLSEDGDGAGGLGMRLVEGLMLQLGGSLERSAGAGARFDIVVPEISPAREPAADR